MQQKFDVHQLQIRGMPVWIFALGFSGGFYRYDLRVLDIDESGQVVGLARLLEYPVASNHEFSAVDALRFLKTLQDAVHAYDTVAEGEAKRLVQT
ncbi:hypothetical protein [Microvirga puerhi]|uniref:Uncharacterized protein n=1 Tax=Microvirga puerhi TaxID=2876078 RepID=A0ABS7VV86_9HYPH|nr:hypothetical protein [Microvirga puerhi]MBZ6078822.1 hypothetical protein [Microvirga puerhi]